MFTVGPARRKVLQPEPAKAVAAADPVIVTRIEQEAPRITATLNLAAAGLGVTIVPESLCGMRLDEIAYRKLATAPQLVAPIRLACRSTDPSAAARQFATLVRREARYLVEIKA